MATITRGMPTPEIVAASVPAGTAGDSNASVLSAPKTVYIPYSTTGGTANADLVSWVNPESTTILVTEVISYFTTTGTGTIDVGVSDDGTGSNDDIINGGTMSNLNYGLRAYRGRTGTEGAGVVGIQDVWVVGPGGTGTNNSIVAKTAETATTAVGALVVTYYTLPS